MQQKHLKHLLLSLCAALIGFGPATGQATTYYVSPNGSDTNSGTSTAAPWKTVGKVNTTTLSPSDVVCFEGGAVFSGTTLVTRGSGTATSPATYTSYGTGKATIQTLGIGGIVIGTSYTTVSNLMVIGDWDTTANTGTTAKIGVTVQTTGKGVQSARLDGLEVSGYGGYGIALQNKTSGLQITNCIVHNNRNTGIYFNAGPSGYPHTNVSVSGCLAYSNSGDSSITNIHTGSGILLGGVNGAVVDGCEAYGNGWRCSTTGGPVGIWSWRSNNVVIQFCESHHNNAINADGGGFDIDGGDTNCIIQYCYAHENAGAGYGNFQYSSAPQMDANHVRYNLSINDGTKRHAGIYVWNGNSPSTFSNSYIYNNTIYVPQGSRPGLLVNGNSTVGTRVWNNIFDVASGAKTIDASTTGSGFALQGNCYWNNGGAFSAKYGSTTYTSLTSYRTGANQESVNGQPTGLAADPLFYRPGATGAIGDAYRLQSTSPLVDAGLDLQALFAINPGIQDFYGEAIPQNVTFDIGAAEYSSTQPPYVPPVTLVMDNADGTGVTITGTWTVSTATTGYYGANYLHDGNTGGGKSVSFQPNIPVAGNYNVYARWTSGSNRATNVPIDIVSASGTDGVVVNQQTGGGQWVLLGTYAFDAGTGANVLISNTGANGYVIVDAVMFERQ